MKKLAALLMSLVLCLSVLVTPIQARCCDANGSGPEYSDTLDEHGEDAGLDDLLMPLDDFPDPEFIDG